MSSNFMKYIKATDYLLRNGNTMSEEEEDALLDEMDGLWWSLTDEEISKVNEYIKSIQNNQDDLEYTDEVLSDEHTILRDQKK